MSRAAGVGLLVLAACRAGAPRPIPLAADEVIKAPQHVVYQAALQEIADQGLPIRSNEPARGILETEYFDVAQFRSAGIDYPTNERLVRLRVTVGPDSLSQDTRLGIQAIYSPFTGPTGESRRGERAVPRGHPVMELVRKIVEDLKDRTRGY